MKNILVTGGCGFIGSHFIKRLCRENIYNVFNIDKLTYAGNKKNIEGLNVTTFYNDIQDDEVHSIIRSCNIDTIVNFAAESHVDRSVRYPKEFLQTDILGLFNLIYNSIKTGSIERFLHIGTDEVYGDAYLGEADETFSLKPNSPYAASKAAADILALSYYKTYELPLLIVRCSNNYGSFQFPEKLIPMVITRILEGRPALMHGDGSNSREWIYVSDCCDAIYEVLLKGQIGEIYNIGSGVRVNNITLVSNLISILLNTNEPQKYITFMTDRPGNDKRYALNSSKVNNLLGREYATTDLIHGLRHTVEWYRSHRGWWPNIDLTANIYDNDNYLR